MGERKVLNKYYPPDFDPAKLPRNKRAKTNDMKVRMMLPMSVRCNTCGNFMYKGTKFNTHKEDVVGETYLGIQIFRFYWRCKKCAAEFTIKTDPQTSDYILEQGATRNYEPWRENEKVKEEVKKQREEEEQGNAMKALENRTLDSKREMDLLAALDEMRSLSNRHARVTTEEALAALVREAQQAASSSAAATAALDDEETSVALAEFMALRSAAAKRMQEDSEDSESSGSQDSRLDGGSGSQGPELASRGAQSELQPGKSSIPGAPPPNEQVAPQLGPSTVSAPPVRPAPTSLAARIVLKPKKVVQSKAAAVTSQPGTGSVTTEVKPEVVESNQGSAPKVGAPAGGNLFGLGDYGSSSNSDTGADSPS